MRAIQNLLDTNHDQKIEATELPRRSRRVYRRCS